MPSLRPSAYPCISAIGVFNSWDTFERKSVLIISSFSFLSISFLSSRLAFLSSAIFCSSFSDILFMLFPSRPISPLSLPSYLALKSISDIFSAILESCLIGLVIYVDTTNAAIIPTARIAPPTYLIRVVDIFTLSFITWIGVLNIIEYPLSSVPHISR